ncbi:hypothetical protein NPIL_457151 [Nephila pilipes]|uniref:Uncharacterized protein n=1 Tax=Nephila pilipes TaxID=299642 RepID=A0A8X6PCM7_NEPPI|nr:hypothetical protein NPIL_457151 [Nephila pilipes]
MSFLSAGAHPDKAPASPLPLKRNQGPSRRLDAATEPLLPPIASNSRRFSDIFCHPRKATEGRPGTTKKRQIAHLSILLPLRIPLLCSSASFHLWM